MRWREEWTELRDKTCLSGHYDFGFWPLLQAHTRTRIEPTFITMLRDPVDRILSLYHWFGHEQQRYQKDVAAMGFGEFAMCERPDWPFLDNDMVRRIAGIRRGVRHYQVDETDLGKAIDNLRRFPCVGLTERFDESIARWAALLGWQSEDYEYKRAQPDRLRAVDLEPSLIDEVRNRQRYDQALYTYVLERDWTTGKKG